MFISGLFSARKQFYSFLFILFSLTSTSQVYFNNMEKLPDSGNWIGTQSIDSGMAFSGYNYSHTDSLLPYGIGIEQEFPKNLKLKNTVLDISGYVMTDNVNNRALYVVTIIDDNKETLLWTGIPIGNVIEEANNWYYFSDSIIIPASITTRSKIKAYLWNQDRNYSTNIDDLKFEFTELQNPTFIPELVIDTVNSLDNKVLAENINYKILYSSTSKTIVIQDNFSADIFSRITYYSDKQIKDNTIVTEAKWKFRGKKQSGKKKELRFKTTDKGGKIKLSIFCNEDNGKLKFTVENRYVRKQSNYRESLVFEYVQPVTEIYRNNRKVDTSDFQDEYWLDNEGVKIGDGDNSAIIYHVPEISSLQLDNINQLLFVNLDYEKDHPFFRFPLNPDSNDWKKEESFSYHKRGEKQVSSFSMVIGNPASTIPRFMKNPTGFEATYIWTEHADYSDIRTNRATYFGSENIHSSDSATGGFVYHNIPITKSVFYDNPDSISNYNASNEVFTSLESTILTDSEFSDFLFQIAEKGSDICLHTPEQFTTTRERLKDALLYMQMNFGSPSWIDHGNNNGPQNNREDLICDATLKKSPFYAIDIWNSFGVKYLHNAYYEELNTYKDWQFEASLEKPFSGYGDFFPKPDYYLHPTRTKNLYHWTTTSALFVKEHRIWNYLFNLKKIEDMVDNWYVEINHVYPAWVDPQKGMWTWGSDSTIISQPGFNQSLSNLAYFRDMGRLNITTIADFLDYRTAIDNIEYQLLPDGRVMLTNNNDFDIEGLSMVGNAKLVTVDGTIPHYKMSQNNIIFWFNLDANSSKLIRLIK